MKAICWHGKEDVRVDTVPDPKIEDARDVIIRVTSTAICGSDLHLYDGFMPTMEAGDVLGHEAMGEVVEVGNQVTKLKKGDRVVVPYCISCGYCYFCKKEMYSLCDTSQCGDRPQGDGALTSRLIWLLPHALRIRHHIDIRQTANGELRLIGVNTRINGERSLIVRDEVTSIHVDLGRGA
jgi:threonine dehydrogenase-like Zn-dependent dehydrogenase